MKRLLMNTVEGGEVRVALMDESRLEEIRVERLGHEQETGNVYKGRVTGVDRGLQAAFVAYGTKKDGFLHASDCLPPDGGYKLLLSRGGRSAKPPPRTRRMGIQEMLKKGAELLVQVTKVGAGRKGSGLTNYLSIPGKYLVLMPAVDRLGVSKKIESESERRALRKALDGLSPPKDMGFIIRTAGLGKRKKELKRDLALRLHPELDGVGEDDAGPGVVAGGVAKGQAGPPRRALPESHEVMVRDESRQPGF